MATQMVPIMQLRPNIPPHSAKFIQENYGTSSFPMWNWVHMIQTGEREFDPESEEDQDRLDEYNQLVAKYGQPPGMSPMQQFVSDVGAPVAGMVAQNIYKAFQDPALSDATIPDTIMAGAKSSFGMGDLPSESLYDARKQALVDIKKSYPGGLPKTHVVIDKLANPALAEKFGLGDVMPGSTVDPSKYYENLQSKGIYAIGKSTGPTKTLMGFGPETSGRSKTFVLPKKFIEERGGEFVKEGGVPTGKVKFTSQLALMDDDNLEQSLLVLKGSDKVPKLYDDPRELAEMGVYAGESPVEAEVVTPDITTGPDFTGRLQSAGVNAAANFGVQLLAGKDPLKAAVSSGASAIGSMVGNYMLPGIGGFIGGALGGMLGGRVICNELHRQGFLERRQVILDYKFTRDYLTPKHVKGYHVWATHVVRKLREGKQISLWRHMAIHRAREIEYIYGERDKPDYLGKIYRHIGEPICWVLGNFCKETDWSVLYQPKEI